jgi:uncharacterized membrane protein HdeD (DUF308 family)
MAFALGLVRGFFRFWYDFLVGDCWEVAAGVVVILAGAILLVRGGMVPHAALPFIVAGAIMLLLVSTTFLELRKKTAGSP